MSETTMAGVTEGVVLEKLHECYDPEIPGVKDAGVEIVYDPPWTPERMTEDARWELGKV